MGKTIRKRDPIARVLKTDPAFTKRRVIEDKTKGSKRQRKLRPQDLDEDETDED